MTSKRSLSRLWDDFREMLYDQVGDLTLHEGSDLAPVRALLLDTDPELVGIDLSLGLLTITNVRSRELPERRKLFDALKELLTKLYGPDRASRVIDGLSPDTPPAMTLMFAKVVQQQQEAADE